jgi:hypothetical protein
MDKDECSEHSSSVNNEFAVTDKVRISDSLSSLR